jgi:beta-barrel assembly-enhancing protease
MRKAILHFVILSCAFFGMWIALSRIDFLTKLKIPQITKESERRITDFILESMRRANNELEADKASALAENIKRRICRANGIAENSITLHILIKHEVNAFALPGRHLVVNTGLIRYCLNPEELSGVIAHEIAHIERNHVMKKLGKEVGLSMLTSMAGGEAGGEIGRQMLKLLSSTAFDRGQEREADLAAVHMMAKADIDPEHLANLLFRLTHGKKDIAISLEWINTHPNAQDRSAEILKLRKKEALIARPIIDQGEWTTYQSRVEAAERNSEKLQKL